MMKATAADANPTPGYLYGEIAKMTNKGGDVVDKVCTFLIDRMKRSKDPNVLYKCLVVIKQTCRKGNQSFRRSVQSPSNLVVVKGCLQFSGTPHPLKGDQPYRAVREAAKDTLEVIFDSSVEVANTSLAQRIQGYGASDGFQKPSAQPTPSYQGARSLPSETQSSSSSYNSDNKKFEGFGNPNFRNVSQEPKGFLDRVKDRIEEYSDVAQKKVATSGIQSWLGTPGKGASREASKSQEYYPAMSSYNGPSTQQQDYSQQNYSQQNYSHPTWGESASSERNRTSSVLSDGAYERGLVEDICSRGGVRPVPSREKINSFLNACKTLEASVVMPLLYEKLNSNDWKMQHKALCVCEALVEGGEETESYVDYLDEHADILEELSSSTQVAVRSRCKKIWALLYGDETPGDAPIQQQQSKEVDLLDMGDTIGDTIGDVATKPTSLFENMDVRKDKSLFESMQVRPNETSPKALFEGMEIKPEVLVEDLLGTNPNSLVDLSFSEPPSSNPVALNTMGSQGFSFLNESSHLYTDPFGAISQNTSNPPSYNQLNVAATVQHVNPSQLPLKKRSPQNPVVPKDKFDFVSMEMGKMK